MPSPAFVLRLSSVFLSVFLSWQIYLVLQGGVLLKFFSIPLAVLFSLLLSLPVLADEDCPHEWVSDDLGFHFCALCGESEECWDEGFGFCPVCGFSFGQPSESECEHEWFSTADGFHSCFLCGQSDPCFDDGSGFCPVCGFFFTSSEHEADDPDPVLPSPVSDFSFLSIFSSGQVSRVVLGEVLGVLPVLLPVLVSFIGLRKGIRFLFGLIRQS